MSFWAYMLHCRGGAYYTGHTDDLERRLAQHQAAAVPGFTAERLPFELVWSEEFGSRDEAEEAERRIKGWSRAKKMALIRGDFDEISRLSKNAPAEPSILSSSKDGPSRQALQEQGQPFDKLRVDGSGGFVLVPHQSAPTDLRLKAEVKRREQALHLTYTLTGDLSRVLVPPPAPPVRTDELWRTTCFELFVKGEGESYREFNFSPSGAWAAYAFNGYRSGMKAAGLPDLPNCNIESQQHSLRLTVAIVLGELFEDLKIGLSAVIELTDGTRIFFALAHPPGAPDFHHQACFAATLPPVQQG